MLREAFILLGVVLMLTSCTTMTGDKDPTDPLQYVKDGQLKVRVKPNADKNEIVRYDDAREELVVRIAEPAQDNKANKELVNYLSNELNKTVWLKNGYNSPNKTLVIED